MQSSRNPAKSRPLSANVKRLMQLARASPQNPDVIKVSRPFTERDLAYCHKQGNLFMEAASMGFSMEDFAPRFMTSQLAGVFDVSFAAANGMENDELSNLLRVPMLLKSPETIVEALYWIDDIISNGAEVDILVWQKTDLGFKVIVNNQFQGLVFQNQIFQPLHSGMKLKAFVDHVRQDGKIDIVLQQTGRQQTLDFAEALLRYLYENDGYCNLGDKSPAELIYDRFQVSKKAFKKAVGDLYKRRLITIADDGIHLTK